jgi:hypothetical protein
VALQQNKALIGREGLLPANKYLRSLRARRPRRDLPSLLATAPTLLWFTNLDNINLYLDLLAYAGLALSFVIMITGAANMMAMLLLWIIYHSLVNVGQRWYGFGWESQLLETGFLAIWMFPMFTWRQLPRLTPTPMVTIYGYRWLIFRIMIGAGLIKIRGDRCWRDLTCMDFHYETQPVPNPIAYFLHQSPSIVHKLEVLGNHFIELVAPFFLWLTRPFVMTGGFIQIFFQIVLVISGNLSFLNWLTMLPNICCFDDRLLAMFFPKSTVDQVLELQSTSETRNFGSYIRSILDLSLFTLIVYLSIPVVQNLFSSRQLMNTNFEPLRIVNTYGAFGSVTKSRTEVIVQGTSALDPTDPDAEWLEYEFKVKPGSVSRRPPFISPFHYRLDWLMWFAAFQDYQHNPWLVHLVAKLLQNDPLMTGLLAHNPFEGTVPPRYIRLEHYHYSFTKLGSADARKGHWWQRRRIGSYMPAVTYRDLLPILQRMDWA